MSESNLTDGDLIRKEKSNKIQELFNLTFDPLFLLFKDSDKQSESLKQLLNDYDPITNDSKQFSIAALPSITDEESFNNTIRTILRREIFHPKSTVALAQSTDHTVTAVTASEAPSASSESASANSESVSASESISSTSKTITATEESNSAALRSTSSALKRKADGSIESRHHKVARTGRYHSSYPPARLITNRIPKHPSAVTSLKSQQQVYEEKLTDFLEKSINDLEIVSVPESYPTSTHNVSSLAELYYLTQTLPLIKLIPGCHKTLMTDNYELALFEGKIAVLYSRIEELKRQSKWSLRQPARYFDPFIYDTNSRKSGSWTVKRQNKTYHWDSVVAEGKWMSADFRESLKYKKACCWELAEAVKEYWVYGKEVCVKWKPIEQKEAALTEVGTDAMEEVEGEAVETVEGVETEVVEAEFEVKPEGENYVKEEPAKEEEGAVIEEEPVPDAEEKPVIAAGEEPVLHSMEVEPSTEVAVSADIDPAQAGIDAAESASIDVNLLLAKPSEQLPDFALPDPILQLKRSSAKLSSKGPFKLHADMQDFRKIDQSIIKNLPKFTAFGDDVIAPVSAPPIKPGESPMVPVSRLLYPFEDDDDWYKIILKDSQAPSVAPSTSHGPPDYQKGLFGVQSHRRFNYLKPPKPPLVKNIEYRSPTIWLPQDDKYLIHYVAEFCFNWELISEHLLSTASTMRKYESNIERRTPWQCFERYIQLNEKFQFSDMKGAYAYQAQQWLEQAHRAQLTTKRRISPLGVGNESIQRGHRRLRWASMFDAMRKSMRKRETQLAKMSQRKGTTPSSSDSSSGVSGTTNSNGITSTNSSNGAVGVSGESNGANPAVSKRDRVPTPAELSRLKFERDKSIQEAYLNQQATRSRMMAAVAQQQRQQLLQSTKPSLLQPPGPQQRLQGPQLQGPTAQLQGPTSQLQGPQGQLQGVAPGQLQGTARNVSPGSQPPMAGRITPSLSILLQQPQRAALSANPVQNPTRVGPSGTQSQGRGPGPAPSASGQLSASQLLQQQQQQQQQLRQQQAFAQIMAKRPTSPNGTPYTPEQIQQLIQIQKQRRLMQQQQQQQQQQQANKSQSQALLNVMTPGQPQGQGQGQKRMSPVNNQQYQPKQPLPVIGQRSTADASAQQRVGQPAAKARIQFAPAQVSAIINSIQTKNPNLTKEQVTRLAATYLANIQQQQQNRLNQQAAPGSAPAQSGAMPQRIGQKPPLLGIAQQRQLTPQERNQLQMLKAAKAAQQQSLSPLDGLQRTTSSPTGTDGQKLSKLQYEERKKLLLQQQQQRINNNMSPLSGASSPSLSNSSLSPGKNLDNGSPN